MDAEYESIYELSQKLSTIEHTLRRRRARLHNFLQPVAALPMEVLQRIFLDAIQPREYFEFGYLPSPITLSEVCSTWRHAAQSYPPIWTVVRLEPCDHRSYSFYARCSGSLSLELHQRKQDYNRTRIAGLEGADVQDRITALSLPLDQTDDWYAQFGDHFWKSKGVPNPESIERLALLATHGVDGSAYSDPLRYLPSLRHLSLDNIFVPLSTTQLANLVTLVVRYVEIDSSEFTEFIEACDNIRELTLDQVDIKCDEDDGIVSIPSLHTLSLIRPNAGFFDGYRVPQLQYFTLRDDIRSYSPAYLCMAENFIADTPTIKVASLKIGPQPLSCILERLWPHSSHLEHDNLRHLTDLTISGHPKWPLDDVKPLIKARLEGHQAELRPLQRLSVPRFMFEDDVDWVRSRVPVLELTDR
ncbi:uncharacterized protein EI90DRAFT_3061651 [Cantharellus anzutake]|uniref:uncharacterized protein n=1 Tax=Cantharellus anzutake TaxID=1750568 RepID=UPI0019054F74|nr:uncharacterized protein EI90DRAFT_3061651 [Cantharellus anzutake]KAF8329714.1 hypothetical protein EI90DRAFT_3061651 [Cantharellus anzutake]